LLHHRQVIDALDPGGSLDRRNEPMDDRTELGQLGRSHVAEVEEMPPGLELWTAPASGSETAANA
jgi:hypothetical protein